MCLLKNVVCTDYVRQKQQAFSDYNLDFDKYRNNEEVPEEDIH